MKRYRLTANATQDLESITDYLLEQGGRRLARHVLGDLESAFEILGQNPNIGHVREDLTPRAFRFWTVYSYLIVYDPATKPIAILDVFHGSRDVEALLNRR